MAKAAAFSGKRLEYFKMQEVQCRYFVKTMADFVSETLNPLIC